MKSIDISIQQTRGVFYLRLYIKKQMLDLLETLTEGVKYMGNNTNTNPESMLEDCICAVLSIERVLQNEGIPDTQSNIKSLLDTFYKMKSCFNTNLEFQTECKKSKAKIHSLKLFIRNKIKTQLEIAFFPYKSSMWDSMESIWKAAVQDKDCSCYVVPIPYYTKKNGVKAEYFYEGNDFPEDVPVVHYSSYDLEKRHPDIIYFHNPYDQCNYVTQVEDTYFSSNLVHFTDMLVYVPYFVYGAYKDMKSAEGFFVTSGSMNADKIIAQSQIHKSYFVKYGLLPEKVIVAGSPKFDAVIQTTRQNFLIPPQWQDKLSGKKIILWNTTIDAMLKKSNWVDKVSHLIDVAMNCSGCALIFRPHPLLEATIRSMRPQYLKSFYDLKNKILSSDNAVLDENRDAYLSIGISNALISDYSSILLQYHATEKPILCLDTKNWFQSEQIHIFDYSQDYFFENEDSVASFCNMVVNGKDPKKNNRLKATRQSTVNIDGNCGKTVHEKIKDICLSI
jgi:hypothetical protein